MISSAAALKSLWAQTSTRARVSLLGILALGVFLRAFLLDTFEFKGDELEAVMNGLAAPAQHWWIERGASSSVRIPLGPAFSYIMGGLTTVSRDPYVLTTFILAANIIVLLLSVLFFAEFSRDKKHFFLCVSLFSLSPYAIIFSRKIWQPDLYLIFVIPLVLMILGAQRNPRLFLPIGLLSAIVVQLHHSGIFYIPLLVFFAFLSFKLPGWRRKRRKSGLPTAAAPPGSADLAADIEAEGEGPESGSRRRPMRAGHPAGGPDIQKAARSLPWAAAGFAVFFILLTPYIAFFFRHFQETGVTRWVSETRHGFPARAVFEWLLFTATGSQFWRHMLSGAVSEWRWPAPPFPGAVLIWCYLLIVPFLLGVFGYARRAAALFRPSPGNPAERAGPKDLLCASSIIFLPLIYCCVLDHGRPHHYAIILPFLILALSEGILTVARYARPWMTPARVLLGAALVSYALQYPFVLLYVNANNGSAGEYGVTYREQNNAAKKIAARAVRGQIAMNPAVDSTQSFSPESRRDLQNTIAYICKEKFGVEVFFNAAARPGDDTLEILRTGDKWHLEIGP